MQELLPRVESGTEAERHAGEQRSNSGDSILIKETGILSQEFY